MPIFAVAGWFLHRYSFAICECAIGPAISSLYIVELIRLMFKTDAFLEIFVRKQNLVGARLDKLWADLFQPAYIVTVAELLLMITRTLIDLHWIFPRFYGRQEPDADNEVPKMAAENVEEAAKFEPSNLPESTDKIV